MEGRKTEIARKLKESRGEGGEKEQPGMNKDDEGPGPGQSLSPGLVL